MRLSILTLSPKAAELAAQVAALFEMEDVVVEAAPGTDPANWMKRHLACADAVVLVGGSGIAAHLAERVLADGGARAAVVLLSYCRQTL